MPMCTAATLGGAGVVQSWTKLRLPGRLATVKNPCPEFWAPAQAFVPLEDTAWVIIYNTVKLNATML